MKVLSRETKHIKSSGSNHVEECILNDESF